MMKEYFESLEKKLEAAVGDGNAGARKIYALELARLGKRLYSGENKVAWCGINVPFDLLNAMGVTSCFVEFIGAMLASSGVVGSFIEETDHVGLSSDSCSYHRAVIGASLKGAMPVPECLIATTNPCSGGVAVLENLAGRFNRSMFTLHIPQDDTGSHVKNLAGQIKDLVYFVARETGSDPDPVLMRLAVEKTNEIREIMTEVYNLAKTVPTPVNNRDLANFGIVMALFFGTDAGVKMAGAFRDELRKRIDNQKAGIPGEKYRLLWIQNRIQFKHPLETLLADEYKAVIVVDELNDITWDAIDPDHMYESMARRSISIPFNGTIENRVKHLQKLVEEYRIDGAVNPCNWGCRQGAGARGLIEKGLKDVGVPVLNLEVDCIDSRKFTEGQMRTRVEAFMEMIK